MTVSSTSALTVMMKTTEVKKAPVKSPKRAIAIANRNKDQEIKFTDDRLGEDQSRARRRGG